MSNFLDEMRQYELRLAQWLGVDPHRIFGLNETDTEWGMSLSWSTADGERHPPAEREGRHVQPFGLSGDSGGLRGQESVLLNHSETQRLRDEVGPRPRLLSDEQRLMLDGLRYRALQQGDER